MRDTHGETASKHESGQTITLIWIRGCETCWSKTTGTELGVEGADPSAGDYLIKPYDVRDLLANLRLIRLVRVLNC